MSNSISKGIVEQKEAIRDVIQKSCFLLDNERFNEWLDLFVEGGVYQLAAMSSEIGAETLWTNAVKEELQRLFEQLPEHVRDVAKRLHIVSNIEIEVREDHASSLSHFVVYRTTREGVTHCYVVGCYADNFIKSGERWLFKRRKAVLDTKMLEIASHVPF